VVVVEPAAEAVVLDPVEVDVAPPVVVLWAWPCDRGLAVRAVTVVARIRGAAFFA
jgi:hypothetical protein